MEQNKNSRFTMSDGVLIAFLTALGYACGYYYDQGYKDYFHIPNDYVELNIALIIKSIGIVFVVLICGLLLGNAIHERLKNVYSKNFLLASLVTNMSISIGIFLSILLIFRFNFYSSIGACLFVISSLIRDYSRYKRERKTLINAVAHFAVLAVHGAKDKIVEVRDQLIDEIDEKEKKFEDGKRNGGFLFNFIFNSSVENRVKGICLFYLLLAVPNVSLLGTFRAATQKEFLVVRDAKDYLVLGNYKDYSIAAEINLKTTELIPRYKLIKDEDMNAQLIKIPLLRVGSPPSVTEVKSK